MLIEAEQRFTLTFPGSQAQALAFLRDPARSLSRLTFLQALEVANDEVRALLVVQMPMLGSVDLPLHSRVVPTTQGARLESLPISGERAWIELSGEGSAEADSTDTANTNITNTNTASTDTVTLHYDFRFVAHLDAPAAEQWGGAAFEKMVRAAAARTLTRLAQALPAGIAAALPTDQRLQESGTGSEPNS